MLGLLPPSPPGGWPSGFLLQGAAEGLEGSMVGTATLSRFVRVEDDYCTLRRAQKFSYVAGTLLGLDQDGRTGQAILEALSTRQPDSNHCTPAIPTACTTRPLLLNPESCAESCILTIQPLCSDPRPSMHNLLFPILNLNPLNIARHPNSLS